MNRLEWYERTAEIILERLEEFYQQFYPDSVVERAGNSYRLQPCPMCGHSDCCSVGEAVHCFSGTCSWRGTHINAWYDYSMNKKGMSLSDAIKELDNFTKLCFPVDGGDFENYKKHQIQQQILAEAEKYYHERLMDCKGKYDFYDANSQTMKGYTPLEYLLSVRQRKMDTITTYRMGFSLDYLELYRRLQSLGFDKEQIGQAKVWVPEGLFVFFYRHPITRDIVRINTKNPFKVKMDIKNEHGQVIDQKIVQGYSSGSKMPYFSAGFTFKKPFTVIEGEHDMFAVIEHGGENAACIGGNPSEEELKIFYRAESAIYLATDNDKAGDDYVEMFNEQLPHKDLRKLSWPKEYKDIDEYYVKGGYTVKPIPELWAESEALPVTDEQYKIHHFGNTWLIENRKKKLEFKIDKKDNRGNLVGTVNFYMDGKISDRADDISLVKCKVKMKPFNFYLADAIEQYFNSDLESKDTDELIDIYWYSSHKPFIIKLLAKKVFDTNSSDEALINKLKVGLRTSDNRDDVFDAILKEVNDLQNQASKISFSDIPKIKISQYFNVRNNDAYFYFINVKLDGDAKRKLPYLLRNDGSLIRLDLLKRKDSQCLLLVDNKYELPFEVNEAILDMRECSLTQEWVEKYIDHQIPPEELMPSHLVREIERYIRKFYYSNDENTYKVLALYMYTTYYYELFGQIPYLYLNGEKGSGKSILNECIHLFALNAKMAINISEASLFRMVAIEGGTIILDEMENLTSRNKGAESPMASILKGGYSRSGMVYRVNQDNTGTEGFDAYGPKVISNIFGLDDIIADRCIPINTYRLDVTPETRKEDPKYYFAEKLAEIREITSKCCISSLENFVKVKTIYDGNLFTTGNARLSQILTPVLAVAKLVDIPEKEKLIDMYPEQDINALKGEYETALMNFYKSTIKSAKEDIDENTPEGIIKRVVPRIAEELWGSVPLKEREYTNPENHKYQEEIKFNKEEGWFEVNVVHFKCFIEESLAGETAYTRLIPRWLRTCYEFTKEEIKRKTVTVASEDLIKEFKGNTKSKLNHYKFYFRDFIKNDFIENETKGQQEKPIVIINMDEKLF